MGCENRRVLCVTQQCQDLLARDAALAQFTQSVIERTVPERLARTNLATPVVMAEVLLRDVDEAEIGREGTYDLFQHVLVQGADQSVETCRAARAVAPTLGDVALAQRLYGSKHLLARALAQHLAQQIAQQSHAAAQRLVDFVWRGHRLHSRRLACSAERADLIAISDRLRVFAHTGRAARGPKAGPVRGTNYGSGLGRFSSLALICDLG